MAKKTYWEVLEEWGLTGSYTEDDLWEAIAEASGVDYSDIADGDLTEWL